MCNQLFTRHRTSALLYAGLFLLNGPTLFSEDKPEPPQIAMAIPFAVLPGAKTKVVVRGWKLNREIEAKSRTDGVAIKVVKHDSAAIPGGQDAKQVGDTLVELDVTVPEGFASETLPIWLMADGLESSQYSLLVGGRFPIVAEAEPNDRFRQAQPLSVPQIVDGQLNEDRNVDVYSIELTMTQKICVQILARRHGSRLDSLLTLFDAKKQFVVSNDDAEGTDSKVELTLPAGQFFIVVQDANDHGGATHPYRLIVEAKD